MRFLLNKRKPEESAFKENQVREKVHVCCDSEDGAPLSQKAFRAMPSAGKRKMDASGDTEMVSLMSDSSSVDTTEAFYGSPRSILHPVSPQESERETFIQKCIRHLQSWMSGQVRPYAVLCQNIDKANDSISNCKLPGTAEFIPVDYSCPMLPIFDYCDIDAISVALGASYFQRLLEKKPSMKVAACKSGWFVQTFNEKTGGVQTRMRAVHCPANTGLLVIYTTCIYIAAKFADRIKYKRLLSALLFSMLDSYVSEETAVDLEARCLSKLEWRLGPILDIDA